jgi:hypothetical protein
VSRTSAQTHEEGRVEAMERGYGTVRRPSERPPMKRRVFGGESGVEGEEDAEEGFGACSKAMRVGV